MPRDYSALPATHVRRADRAIKDEAWIESFLLRAPVGVLATVHEGQPFLNSNLFIYAPQRRAIYMHTARVGRTRANIEQAEKVCFSIFEMGRLLPAATALEFSVEYAGVVVFGEAALIGGEEAREALQWLLDKYAPHLRPERDYRPVTDEELDRTAVYRIAITGWSGKQKAVSADFPGAFTYPLAL